MYAPRLAGRALVQEPIRHFNAGGEQAHGEGFYWVTSISITLRILFRGSIRGTLGVP